MLLHAIMDLCEPMLDRWLIATRLLVETAREGKSQFDGSSIFPVAQFGA